MPSLFARVTRGLVLKIYLVGLIQFALVAFGMYLHSRIERRHGNPGEELAKYIAETLGQASGDREALNSEVSRLQRRLRWSFTLRDADGKVLAEVVRPGATPGIHSSIPVTLADGSTGSMEYVPPPPPHPPPRAWLPISLVLVVVGGASWMTARSLANPLKRLGATAKALGSGQLDARVNLRRSDELGDVAHAFDEMANRVAQLLRIEKELLANVSHELRTPLARIRVALDIAAEGDAALAQETLKEIAEDLAELERIVSDVLTAARLSLQDGATNASAAPPTRVEPTDLGALIERSVQKFNAAHAGRPLKVVTPSDMPLIEADPMLLRRVVDNLLDNAHAYTEDKTSEISLMVKADEANVDIVVSDHGVGISPADLERVFEPFFRADRSRTRATGGLGLGLALARRIIEAHGGTLKLESILGKGTTARIVLPLQGAPSSIPNPS